MFIVLDVWMSVVTGYIYPKSLPTDIEQIKQFGYNTKVVNAILDGLERTVYAKVMHFITSKEIWDKL